MSTTATPPSKKKTSSLPAKARLTADVPPAQKLAGPVSIAIKSDLQMVRVEDVTFTDNPRDPASFSPEAVAGMADSLVRSGQLQPITVWLAKGRLLLLCGQLRVLGARKAGLKDLRALVLEREPTEDERQRMQAAENLQREAFGLVQEAELVAARYLHYSRQPVGVDKTALERVSQELARSPRWVQERLRVSRLAEPVRKMITAGTVTFGAALLLCRVADHGTQLKLAKQYERDWYEGQPPELEMLRVEVDQAAMSLRQVAWDREVPLPGIDAPPCSVCPHNSDNDRALFDLAPKEAGKSQMKEATCGLRSCYDKKAKWAASQLSKTVPDEAKAIARSDLPNGKPTEKAVEKAIKERAFVPAGLAPQAFGEAVKAALVKPEKKAGLEPGEPRKTDYAALERRRRAVSKLRDEWFQKVKHAVLVACVQKPGRLAALHALVHSEVIEGSQGYTKTLRAKAKVSPDLAKAINGMVKQGPADLPTLDRMVTETAHLDEMIDRLFDPLGDAARKLIFDALNIHVAPEPTARDVFAQERAAAELKKGAKKAEAAAKPVSPKASPAQGKPKATAAPKAQPVSPARGKPGPGTEPPEDEDEG